MSLVDVGISKTHKNLPSQMYSWKKNTSYYKLTTEKESRYLTTNPKWASQYTLVFFVSDWPEFFASKYKVWLENKVKFKKDWAILF